MIKKKKQNKTKNKTKQKFKNQKKAENPDQTGFADLRQYGLNVDFIGKVIHTTSVHK